MAPIIDTHIHWQSDDTHTLSLFQELDIHIINICLQQHTDEDWRSEQVAVYRDFARVHPDRFAWITSFDLPSFDDPTYIERITSQVAEDFATGAVGCKIWKNIGMDIKKPDGTFLMPDDVLFDPLWETIAASGRTLLAHLAEPMDCWRKLDEASPHFRYYSENPQWHMFNNPEYPHHEEIMAARDHVLERHPKLQMVGAHLASLEWDADVLSERLDRFPNLAVDTSARVANLAFQDPQKVRRLFEAHPERILFGTDRGLMGNANGWSDVDLQQRVQGLRACYKMNFAYFESAGMVTVNGRHVQGLGLAPRILERLYFTNAQRWYPHLRF